MSYSDDVITGLSHALNRLDGLKQGLNEFNDNIEVLKELAFQLKRLNDNLEVQSDKPFSRIIK